jgi:hypothetical protein
MAIRKTIQQIVANPAGTARVIEGCCTLDRAAEAGVTPSQLRVIYPTLQPFSDAAISGFTDIGGMLLKGDARFAADPLDSGHGQPRWAHYFPPA